MGVSFWIRSMNTQKLKEKPLPVGLLLSNLDSSAAEEGSAAAFIRRRLRRRMKVEAGVVLVNKLNCLTSTTPASRSRRLRGFLLIARPPLLAEEGSFCSLQFIHTFIHRAYSNF